MDGTAVGGCTREAEAWLRKMEAVCHVAPRQPPHGAGPLVRLLSVEFTVSVFYRYRHLGVPPSHPITP